MAQLIETTRIANDPVLRYTPDQIAVLNLSLPCEHGKKDPATNRRPVMWVDASLWGKQAEALAPYLVKGQWIGVTVDDVHLEEFQSQGSTRTKVVGRISSIKLAGSSQNQAQQSAGNSGHQPSAQSAQQAYGVSRPAAQAPAQEPARFEDFDDDIPF